jgi:murein DD-endopeptidase MepM/ murein hydrolase activator NlpD
MTGVTSTALPPPGAGSVATYAPAQPTAGFGAGPVVGAVAAAPSQPGWSATGGSRVTLGAGETVQSISQRYGVPEAAILQANGLQAGAAVPPGSQLIIPVYSAGSSTVAAAPAAGAPTASASSHTVTSGETLSGVARQYGVTRAALASANNLTPDSGLRIGQRLTIPAGGATGAAPVVAALTPQPPTLAPASAVAAPLAPAAAAAAPVAAAPPPQVAAVAQPTEADGGQGTFRWPVRGRIISAFGVKPNGERNDGINLEVPEGTPIRASEGGTVVYAGNELRGYGNLVLIRHANGFVSAYAHASSIDVQRGDTITRGQQIGLVGATGSVNRPQLHFELRDGNRPVDPIPYLSG